MVSGSLSRALLKPGIGVPLIALYHSIKLMKVQGHEFSIINSVVVEHNEDAAKLNESTLQQHGYPGNIFAIKKMEDLSQWILEHLCENSMIPWKDTMLLVMTGTPCKSISYGCKANKNRTQFGIHASPSNVWFLAHSAIFQLCQILAKTHCLLKCIALRKPHSRVYTKLKK